ncbi:DUF6035 family protein [Nevskia soli]|uniref:DUF6035 family protein n=1 Tax=Nevskia soli TaxID=418856 RepID=UPI0004A6D81C|nr:DUF6035 family protein [Nevskia soli]
MPALSVANPEINEVRDLSTGQLLASKQLINEDDGAISKLRLRLYEDEIEGRRGYVCSTCNVPVYLVSTPDRGRFFFRHKIEDGSCPARTRGLLSEREILARKFHGQRESEPHLRVKALLQQSLQADSNFADVKVEAVWKSFDEEQWRKPDVSACYRGLPVAFEIQLSTTFVRVVAERRSFYRQQGALLIWVFDHFDDAARRLTEDDIFYNNNCNAFVVTAKTLAASNAAGAFRLGCCWALPGDAAGSKLQRALIGFAELTLDLAGQRAFYFDHDGEVERLRLQREAAVRQRAEQAAEAFRQRLLRYIHAYLRTRANDLEVWDALRSDARKHGFQFDRYPGSLPWTLIMTLLSAQADRPVGFKFRSMKEVAHNIYPGKAKYLRYFLHAIQICGTGRDLADGKAWQERVRQYTPLLGARDVSVVADVAPLPLVDFLFPELRLREMDLGEPETAR